MTEHDDGNGCRGALIGLALGAGLWAILWVLIQALREVVS